MITKKLMATVLTLAIAVSSPATAAILKEFHYPNYGVGFGGVELQNYSPEFGFIVNGTEYLTVPISEGNTVIDLSGAAFDAAVAALTDGIKDDSYAFRLAVDGVLDEFQLTLFLTDSFLFSGEPSDLIGQTIAAIRIRIDDLCIRTLPSDGCAFPSPEFIGFGSSLTFTVSDTPFDEVPEPAILGLFGLGLAGAGVFRRLRPFAI